MWTHVRLDVRQGAWVGGRRGFETGSQGYGVSRDMGDGVYPWLSPHVSRDPVSLLPWLPVSHPRTLAVAKRRALRTYIHTL